MATRALSADPPIQQMVIRPPSRQDVVLVVRGEFALLRLDVVEARLLLEGPADRGDPRAARGMAETYDPVWLLKNGLLSWEDFADPHRAYEWYKRAAESGDTLPGNLYLEAKK